MALQYVFSNYSLVWLIFTFQLNSHCAASSNFFSFNPNLRGLQTNYDYNMQKVWRGQVLAGSGHYNPPVPNPHRRVHLQARVGGASAALPQMAAQRRVSHVTTPQDLLLKVGTSKDLNLGPSARLSEDVAVVLPLCCNMVKDDVISYNCPNTLSTDTPDNSFKMKVWTAPAQMVASQNPTKFRLVSSSLKCKYGAFSTRLSTQQKASKSSSHFTPDGYFKHNSEYFRPDEYCVRGLSNSHIEVQMCRINCQDPETPCIQKCCGKDEIYSFGFGDNPRGCTKVRGKAQKWYPSLYHSMDLKMTGEEAAQLNPHIVQKFPTSFKYSCRFNKTTVFPYGKGIAEFLSTITRKKFRNLEFRMRKDGWLLYPSQNPSVSDGFAKQLDNYCVDGAQDFGENVPYSNSEEESILFLCSGGVEEAFGTKPLRSHASVSTTTSTPATTSVLPISPPLTNIVSGASKNPDSFQLLSSPNNGVNNDFINSMATDMIYSTIRKNPIVQQYSTIIKMPNNGQAIISNPSDSNFNVTLKSDGSTEEINLTLMPKTQKPTKDAPRTVTPNKISNLSVSGSSISSHDSEGPPNSFPKVSIGNAEELSSGSAEFFRSSSLGSGSFEIEIEDKFAAASVENENSLAVDSDSYFTKPNSEKESILQSEEDDLIIPAVLKVGVKVPPVPQTFPKPVQIVTQPSIAKVKKKTKPLLSVSTQAGFNHNNGDKKMTSGQGKSDLEGPLIGTCCDFASNVNDGFTHHCRNKNSFSRPSFPKRPKLWSVSPHFMTRGEGRKFRLQKQPVSCGKGKFQFQGFVHNFEKQGGQSSGERRSGMLTNGYLKYDNEFYAPNQYCINGISPRIVEVLICKPDCSQWETPCIQKCCGMDEIYSLGLESGSRGCQSLRKEDNQFSPQLYKSMEELVPEEEMTLIHPHFIQKYPPNFQHLCFNKITLAFPFSKMIASKLTPADSSQRGDISFKHLQFRKDGKLMYSYPDLQTNSSFSAVYERGEYCVDAVKDYGENDRFRNFENQTILFICASEPSKKHRFRQAATIKT